jgi:WXG100 family type VII secretion target
MSGQVQIGNRNAQIEANKLEAMFASLPGVVQDVLYEPYSWMDDKLKMVAGNPEELLTAGSTYQSLAGAVAVLQQQAQGDVRALLATWQGEDATAYAGRMAELDDALTTLVDSLVKMPELLESGAQACVDGANMIVDIVVALIMFAIGTFVINAALSVITFGISMAAEVAEVLAEAAASMARALQVVQKVAQVLTKISNILLRIARVLDEVSDIFAGLKALLAFTKMAGEGAVGLDWVAAKTVFGVQKAVAAKAVWAVTGGQVNIPGGVGKLFGGAGDYKDGWDAASDAQDQAG